jgi:hypothetical protein
MKIEKETIEAGIEERQKFLDGLREKNLEQILYNKDPFNLCFNDLDDLRSKKKEFEEYLKTLEGFKNIKNFKDEIKSAVYIISATDFPFTQRKEISVLFDEKKAAGIAMCRINSDDDWSKNKNNCLYVGSSHDIVHRIMEHWGKSHKRTYALHLNDWFWEKIPNSKVSMYIWNTTELTDDKEKETAYLQIIEEILWVHYHPLFGRCGAK